jgi:hypothetical protein
LSAALNLVEEIITLASSESASVSTLLRKSLVLAHTLRNDRLKTWAESELNGYEQKNDSVPSYRKTSAQARGLFVGPLGSYINDQPIPPAILEEHHRHWAQELELTQPIAAYENATANSKMVFPWPANLTALYQSKFIRGYSLNRAWQDVPSSVIVGLNWRTEWSSGWAREQPRHWP